MMTTFSFGVSQNNGKFDKGLRNLRNALHNTTHLISLEFNFNFCQHAGNKVLEQIAE